MEHGFVGRATGRLLALVIGSVAAAALFVIIVLAGGTPAHVATGGADAQSSLAIEPESDYEGAVLELALRAISNRAGDPYFAPDSVVTRAQVAVYVARLLQIPKGQTLAFADVGAAQWGYGYIGPLCDLGLMQGTSPTAFSPGAPVSRQEAAYIVIGALRYLADQSGADLPAALSSTGRSDTWLAGFQDRDLIALQYKPAVAGAYAAGLFDAPAGGWLLPELGMTHLELLVMLNRTFVEAVAERTELISAVDPVAAYPDLSKGSSGGLVKVLQERLNALHYYCGDPDGNFSAHTRDAVYAFQKYYRLKRTGVVDQTVWDALFSASAPVPVYQSGPTRRVEVDLTRQIMMLIDTEQVVMVVHVSTGKFGTPTGMWRTRTLSHGWRPTSLGPIYSPSYFMPRNAIHGYPSVPLYPASHNCVRTPIWIQDRVIDMLEMDELVHVFYNKAE
jgi:hypothetical protein